MNKTEARIQRKLERLRSRDLQLETIFWAIQGRHKSWKYATAAVISQTLRKFATFLECNISDHNSLLRRFAD